MDDLCPCGSPHTSPWPFHRTSDCECVHHITDECGLCKAVSRLISETEQVLKREAA